MGAPAAMQAMVRGFNVCLEWTFELSYLGGRQLSAGKFILERSGEGFNATDLEFWRRNDLWPLWKTYWRGCSSLSSLLLLRNNSVWKPTTLKKSFQLEDGIHNVIMTRNLTPERYIGLFEVLSETGSVHWVQWRFFNWLYTAFFVWPWKMVSVSVRYLFYQRKNQNMEGAFHLGKKKRKFRWQQRWNFQLVKSCSIWL